MSNRLASEKSPYLLQHKDNPVNWYAWGEEAFLAARSQDKPIFLSIGYSTCYWCHVMEKDSFENQDVASLLNQNFISIKVDREERPDVDQIYMEAVVALTRHGGWPMSMFLTSDLKPFWGGTFFPKHKFVQILDGISAAWRNDREKVLNSAGEITQSLQDRALPTEEQLLSRETFEHAKVALSDHFDPEHGGFGGAPKFPPATAVSLLFRIFDLLKDQDALEMGLYTLNKMARGGIYDQIGGGFHRYATDESWLVPHFEKMLYDNALLVKSYLEAFQISQELFYAQVARDTLSYLVRDMLAAEGGFYSAEDAGAVGQEGEFYVWLEAELVSLLSPEELALAKRTFQVEAGGNFEHGTIILALRDELENSELCSAELSQLRAKLLTARGLRSRPSKDTKILTAWNGLTISAFSKGYQVLGDAKLLQVAEGAARFIKDTMCRDGQLMRRYFNGEVGIDACLEDYAYLIEGVLDLYESTFDESWLLFARDLQMQQDKVLYDEKTRSYFYSASPELVIKRKDLLDNATPAANSVSATNLMRLGHYFMDHGFQNRARAMLQALSPLVARHPFAVARALHALHFEVQGPFELVIVGMQEDSTRQVLKQVYSKFLPDRILALAKQGESSRIPIFQEKGSGYHLCRDMKCLPVVTEAQEILGFVS